MTFFTVPFYNRHCRQKDGFHRQLCTCGGGPDFIKICPATKNHSCQCAGGESKSRCRVHKTFEIWNMWESSSGDSYIYWLPEEVIIEMIEILTYETTCKRKK
jgi:hypothetical protein